MANAGISVSHSTSVGRGPIQAGQHRGAEYCKGDIEAPQVALELPDEVVALGAAIGTFSGRKVVQYMHGHPGNRLDHFMLSTQIVPDGRGGARISTSIPFP